MEKARPWLHVVWERGFTTEDEADEGYEHFAEWLAAPFEVDRLDGNTIRVYLDTKKLEGAAQLIEANYEPPTIVCTCTCGHLAAAHRGEEALCTVSRCKCRGFERHNHKEAA